MTRERFLAALAGALVWPAQALARRPVFRRVASLPLLLNQKHHPP